MRKFILSCGLLSGVGGRVGPLCGVCVCVCVVGGGGGGGGGMGICLQVRFLLRNMSGS